MKDIELSEINREYSELVSALEQIKNFDFDHGTFKSFMETDFPTYLEGDDDFDLSAVELLHTWTDEISLGKDHFEGMSDDPNAYFKSILQMFKHFMIDLCKGKYPSIEVSSKTIFHVVGATALHEKGLDPIAATVLICLLVEKGSRVGHRKLCQIVNGWETLRQDGKI